MNELELKDYCELCNVEKNETNRLLIVKTYKIFQTLCWGCYEDYIDKKYSDNYRH